MKTFFKWLFPIVTLAFSTTTYAQPPSSRIQFETSMGTIVLELDMQAAPKTTANFMSYVKEGYYENTIFHRVIPNFMIQGGGFTSEMKQKPTREAIANEADNGLKNKAGTIAMARTNDPHSATSQFFINAVDNAFLDHKAKNPQGWGYCVFGRVVEGMDVVKAIEKVPTTMRAGHRDVPSEPVVVLKATILDPKQRAAPPAAAPSEKPPTAAPPAKK
jgi:peptidyl-prolyl cis-trans isomerase B (cyclophilin B)